MEAVELDYRIETRDRQMDYIDEFVDERQKSWCIQCGTGIGEVRAGEKLSESEMRVLVQRLLNTRKPNVCPHGRPIILRIPLTET